MRGLRPLLPQCRNNQEIGREINTLGAKAYSSDIQRLVVNMKDELEKIKEQVANIV